MRVQIASQPRVFFALALFFLVNLSTARADWLAGGNPLSIPDGQPIWRLADTNGAVVNRFANLTLYHQEWMAMTIGPGRKVYVVRNGGDTMGESIDIYAPNGAGVGSIRVGPFSNGDLVDPGSLTVGRDGNVYIADTYQSTISRYSTTNGAFLGTFVSGASVNGLTFGPDGNLYVADSNLGVVRYNGTNGAFMDTFVPLGTNGVPDAANLIFGPDSNLYVCSAISNAVFRFDGSTGQFMDDFVPPGSGGLSSPHWPAFGPDGNFYVGAGTIFRYDGRTGAFLNTFGSRADWGLVYLSDTNPPVPTVTSPTNAATVTGTIIVTASAIDDGVVAAIQFQLDGVNSSPAMTSTPYSTAWDTTTATDGAHTLTAVAWDAAGNEGVSAPVTVMVANGDPADTTPPAVAVTAPADNATVSGAVTISADATDNVSVAFVQFQLDGVNLGWQITNAPYSLTWNTASATNGAHVLTAIARDTAGNQTVSTAVALTVTNSNPGPTFFVSDASGNILKIAPDGTQSLFATASNAFYGLAFDRAGNLFAAEYNAGIIHEFSPAGAQTAFTTASNSCQAYSLAFDRGGNLFADCANVIYKYTPDGTRSVFTTTALNASYPSAEFFDSAGNFYFTTWTFNTPNGGPQDIITEFEPDGSSRTYETLQGFQGFYGMAFDSGGTLRLNAGGGMAVDLYGNLYEADRNNGNIYKFAPDGTQTIYAGGLNGPIGLALAPVVTAPDPAPQPPPVLSIQWTNNSALISWPVAAGTNWTLCRRQGLASANAWTALTNAPALVGANCVVTEPCTSAACFYRLEKR